MKAILVIDLNDTTLNECDTDVSKCWAKVIVHTHIKGTAHGIGSCIYANDNVELKPRPQELPTPYMVRQIQIAEGIQTEKPPYTEEYQRGYNDCIDEILGGE